VEKVGDDTMNGRAADKYRYATTTNTSTSAGEVKSEAFVYVDKETGLPLPAHCRCFDSTARGVRERQPCFFINVNKASLFTSPAEVDVFVVVA